MLNVTIVKPNGERVQSSGNRATAAIVNSLSRENRAKIHAVRNAR